MPKHGIENNGLQGHSILYGWTIKIKSGFYNELPRHLVITVTTRKGRIVLRMEGLDVKIFLKNSISLHLRRTIPSLSGWHILRTLSASEIPGLCNK